MIGQSKTAIRWLLAAAGVLTVLPVALNVRMESFGIVTRRGRRLSPGAEALLKVLRETAARLYSRRLPERVRPRARTAAS